MDLQSADQIIARIKDAIAERPGGVLAFDGDGTLWDGDVGEDFYFGFVDRGEFRQPALAQMQREALEFGLSAQGTGQELARSLYKDYLAGKYPEERVCELMTWVCADWTRSEVDAFAAKVIAESGLAARLHKEVRKVVLWAEKSGIETFLVSASPWAIIEHAARVVGLPPTHIIAAQPRYMADRMLPEVERPIPYGPGKVSHLRQRIGSTREIYAAFGDNAFDIALLSEAFIPVAVRPKPRLRERAGEVESLVEIEREG
jgi:phosphatidylglycerophosphatase C